MSFSSGCVLFQVFATGQQDADLSPVTEAWLTPADPCQAALLTIAPASEPLCSAPGTGKSWPRGCARGLPAAT